MMATLCQQARFWEFARQMSTIQRFKSLKAVHPSKSDGSPSKILILHRVKNRENPGGSGADVSCPTVKSVRRRWQISVPITHGSYSLVYSTKSEWSKLFPAGHNSNSLQREGQNSSGLVVTAGTC